MGHSFNIAERGIHTITLFNNASHTNKTVIDFINKKALIKT